MSAELSDAAPAPIRLPRTIKAVRSALTPEEREQFAADLDDSAAGGLAQVVERWWMHAIVNLTPGAWDRVERARTGALPTVPIEDVLPELRAAR